MPKATASNTVASCELDRHEQEELRRQPVVCPAALKSSHVVAFLFHTAQPLAQINQYGERLQAQRTTYPHFMTKIASGSTLDQLFALQQLKYLQEHLLHIPV